MGKNLIQQRRGRGTLKFRSPSFNFKGEAKHYPREATGTVIDLIHCPGHTAPLMEIQYFNREKNLAIAPENIKVGDPVSLGSAEKGLVAQEGNVLALRDIPEGTLVHNLELKPGDGGKLVRASGTFAKVVSRSERAVRIKLPSKQEKDFLPECRAAIGIVAGAGRLEKPFLKAGAKYRKMKARRHLYPVVSGISMNAVDHPFGGKCSHVKGRPTQSPRNAPPGRKVGKIAPRRTGRKK